MLVPDEPKHSMVATRRSSLRSASGSEYQMSERSVHDEPEPDPERDESPPEYITTTRGRKVQRKIYEESDEDAEGSLDPDIDVDGGSATPAAGDLFADDVKVERGGQPVAARGRRPVVEGGQQEQREGEGHRAILKGRGRRDPEATTGDSRREASGGTLDGGRADRLP